MISEMCSFVCVFTIQSLRAFLDDAIRNKLPVRKSRARKDECYKLPWEETGATGCPGGVGTPQATRGRRADATGCPEERRTPQAIRAPSDEADAATSPVVAAGEFPAVGSSPEVVAGQFPAVGSSPEMVAGRFLAVGSSLVVVEGPLFAVGRQYSGSDVLELDNCSKSGSTTGNDGSASEWEVESGSKSTYSLFDGSGASVNGGAKGFPRGRLAVGCGLPDERTEPSTTRFIPTTRMKFIFKIKTILNHRDMLHNVDGFRESLW